MMEKTLIIDNALTQAECDYLINESTPLMGDELPSPWNYRFYDFPLYHSLNIKLGNFIVSEYVNRYPEINYTYNTWYLEHFRIKVFRPGKYYDDWHSEQGYHIPRIASVLVYLSDHDSGTEFYNGEVILSKKGRAAIFPAFWTHAHRGHPCPQQKERFIMTSYIVLKDDR